MKKIIAILYTVLIYIQLAAQTGSSLDRKLFERNMYEVAEKLDNKIKKGDSSVMSDYGYALKRLRQNTKAYDAYQIAHRMGGISKLSHWIDFNNLSKELNKPNPVIESKLKSLGLVEASTPKHFTQLADIDNFCANSSSDDIYCQTHSEAIIIASTRNSVNQKNIENSYLKLFSVNQNCVVNDAKTINNIKLQIGKKHTGPMHTSSGLLFVTYSNEKVSKQGINNLKIVYSNKEGVWLDLPINSIDYNVQHPFFDANTNKLYFSSDMPSGKGGFDIYSISYNPTLSTWGDVTPLKYINTAADEVFPTADLQGNVYYSTTPSNGLGGLDILCLKSGSTIPFILSSPINSNFDDFSYQVNSDLSGYFTSNRFGGKGGDDIYSFSIDTTPYTVCFNIKNTSNQTPVAGVKIDTKIIQNSSLTTDENGVACIQISALDMTADAMISYAAGKPKFISSSGNQAINKSKNRNITIDISLEPEKPVVAKAQIKVGQDLGKLLNLNPIYFDLGKWDVRPDAAEELDKIVAAMIEYPNLVIELGSHTDSRASAAFNQNLSQKRAESSAKYVISKGIDPNRISWKGYGKSKIINRCKDGVKCTDEEHAANRRTEFKIVKM
jgi:outer membrane protein OmpA-like peptidoglycan-associated protein